MFILYIKYKGICLFI